MDIFEKLHDQYTKIALAALEWDGKLVVYGMDVPYHEIVMAWNKAHPDDDLEI